MGDGKNAPAVECGCVKLAAKWLTKQPAGAPMCRSRSEHIAAAVIARDWGCADLT